ncbi:hypothetical protein JTB14_017088 [Gonioctena quinquepunctata]|nr:hypothetical protein JTB14_017088 [Gonioctena quinquepunctata]
MIEQTNLYSTQDKGAIIDTNHKEMTDFISILLLMGIIQLPAHEDYWAAGTRIEQIARIMPAHYELIELEVVQLKMIRFCKSKEEERMTMRLTKRKVSSSSNGLTINVCYLAYGVEQTSSVKRYCKTAEMKTDIVCPSVITYYKHMGGVDESNALMGLHKTPSKAKRWYY